VFLSEGEEVVLQDEEDVVLPGEEEAFEYLSVRAGCEELDKVCGDTSL
jgi:hypothetical protein